MNAVFAPLFAVVLMSLAMVLPGQAHGETSSHQHLRTDLDVITTTRHLIMVEQDGCQYCARWHAEIAEIYPKTLEGQFAPLKRVELRGDWDEEIKTKGPALFTPSFLLVENGQELGRIEGYANDELFWAMLSVLLRDHGGEAWGLKSTDQDPPGEG